MLKWEYKAIPFNLSFHGESDEAAKVVQKLYENRLNEFGKDGWELVTITSNAFLIFKKQE